MEIRRVGASPTGCHRRNTAECQSGTPQVCTYNIIGSPGRGDTTLPPRFSRPAAERRSPVGGERGGNDDRSVSNPHFPTPRHHTQRSIGMV